MDKRFPLNDENMVNKIINRYRFCDFYNVSQKQLLFYFLVSSYLFVANVHELYKYIQLYSMTEWIIVISSQQITTLLAYHHW